MNETQYPPIRFSTGEIACVGDRVSIKRTLRRNQSGVVRFTYNPELPIVPNGENQYGITIELDNGAFLYVDPPPVDPIVDKRIVFLGRETAESE